MTWSFLWTMKSVGAPRSTWDRYKSNAMALLEFDGYGARAITTIDGPQLAAFIDAGASRDIRIARRTIANRVMSHAYRYGNTKRLVEAPPSAYAPRQDRHREWTRYSAEQLRQLRNGAPCPRSRVAIAIASYTAMRIEDVRILRAPAVNLADQWLSTFIQKTGVYDFKVISGGLEQELRIYLSWLYSCADGVVTADDYLIPAFPRGAYGLAYDAEAVDLSAPIGYNTLGDRFVEARTNAGLPFLPRERWHAVRRSAGRLFFEAAARHGYDLALRMTQAFLNHQSIETTERYIGLGTAYAARDEFLRSHDFLAVEESGNVIPLSRSR
ncbi:hypothetical protein ACMA1D_10555 [Streptomyces sp. 796.1]|uniref:hypothetical protein n=1 Tax=Streptomyces sp. 796.1 TaxID=3163029 RepID=UPI0039C9BCD0